MNDLTILYYTSNREDEKFEQNIREIILKNKGDLPLVSVSQKPIDFGKNICVGVHENSYVSEFMQIRVGLEAINTPFVITAEADFLYPPEYFQYSPNERDCFYRYNGVWIIPLYEGSAKFYCKGFSDGCQIVDRMYWLDLINSGLPNKNDWTQKCLSRCQPSHKDHLRTWSSPNPAVSFKTINGVSRRTQLRKRKLPVTTLPCWGDATDLIKKMFSKT